MLKSTYLAVLRSILYVTLYLMFNLSAYADARINLEHFNIAIEQDTGRMLATTNEEKAANRTDDSVLLLEMSLVESQSLILTNQTSYPDDLDNPVTETTFLLDDQLQIVRRVNPDPDNKFLIIAYELSNISVNPVNLAGEQRPRFLVGEGLSSLEDPGGGYGAWLYSFRYAFIATATDAVNLDPAMLNEGKQVERGNWFGWTNRYFAVAARPTNSRWRLHQTDSTADGDPLAPENLLLEFIPESEILAPGDSIEFQFHCMLVPKERDLLRHDKIELNRLLFLNLWDWFRWLCFGIWALIDLLFLLCGNWGVTIILLALVIRLVTIPVTRLSLRYQEKSIQQQARIAPLIREIKETSKGLDQSERLIKLYEDEQYDHLAAFKAMMGLFVQIPIFIALFNILGEAFELRGVEFLWIDNLATSDRLFKVGLDVPYFGSYFNLLPFLMASITALSTWLSARHSGSARAQTGTLFGMAGVFFVLFYSFPSALVLYWMFSNLFQMIQQSLENHKAP